MADKLHTHACFLVDFLFEWKYHQHLVDEFPNRSNAAFTRCPDVRADVVHDRTAGCSYAPCQREIESRKINQDRGGWGLLLNSVGKPMKQFVESRQTKQRAHGAHD